MAPKYIGAHVSASGGLANAPANAAEIGATAFALFVKNQRQWSAPPVTREQADAFKLACEKHGFDPRQILPHDTYLINLGAPDAENLKKSRSAFIDEMLRCQALGLEMLNFHPGSHRGLITADASLRLIAESVNMALDKSSGVTAVIENTAGQGGSMGRTFEEIAFLLDKIEDKSRAGVCLDTCHLFAAGYDLRSQEAYEETMAAFDRVVGFKYLRAMHLNDCKPEFGSRVDRHQSLGKGTIGLEAFRMIALDERLEEIPLILETPEPALWPQEITALRNFAKNAGGSVVSKLQARRAGRP